LLPMSAVSFPPKSKETRARQPPPLPCGPSSDRRKIFPTTSYTQERNSTSKKSTKHRAPDRFPRPRPSSRRRRKTSSLFLLLCVYALFFEREETARSKFVLKNSILLSLSLSPRGFEKKKREKNTSDEKKKKKKKKKKSENDDDDEGAKSFNHY